MRACGTQILEDHEHSVRGLVFSPDGTLLASASDNRVRIWRVRDWESPPLGEEIERQAEPKAFSAVTFSSDGALLAAGAHLWRVSDWKRVRTLQTRIVIRDKSFDIGEVEGAAFCRVRAFLAELIRVARKANKGARKFDPRSRTGPKRL